MDFLPSAFNALANYDQFIIYKIVPRPNNNNKTDKIPICPKTLKKYIDHLNPVNQLSAEQAITYSKILGDSYGVGFVFTEKDPFWFLDIDNCLEPCGTKWSALSIQMLTELHGCAVEVSNSKKGLHIIGKGILPPHKCTNKKLGLELYTEKHFVALTGMQASGNCGFENNFIYDVVNEYFKLDTEISNIQEPNLSNTLDDQKILDLALKSKSTRTIFGQKASFKDLWEANVEKLSIAYPTNNNLSTYDESAADAALAQHLAFWTAKNKERIKKLMMQSSLNRPKWDRKDYLDTTIIKACKRQKDVFSPIVASKELIKKSEYPEVIITNSGCKVLNTYNNLKYLLDTYNISVCWNDMSRTREITIPGFDIFYDDEENSALNEIINLAILNQMPITRIDEHLNSLSQKEHYHPIVRAITNTPWDGKSRLMDFYKTLKTANDKLSQILLYRWMISAIASAFSEKGFAAQGVLVLKGKQNINKTRWIQSLDPIQCGAVKEGAILDPSNKDNIITLSQYWIVELGELDGTFNKSDIARLKSHVTNLLDIIRNPYARKNSRYARRTVYAASVNESNFLVDTTGNRRWWVIDVESINLNHGINMQQLWAEIHNLWQAGEQPWLTQEELDLLNKSNLEHEQLDPFEEKVIKIFNFDDYSKTELLTASDVLSLIGYKTPTKAETTRMGKILMKLTGNKADRRYHTLPNRRSLISSNIVSFSG